MSRLECSDCGKSRPAVLIEYYERIDRDGCPECNPIEVDVTKARV